VWMPLEGWNGKFQAVVTAVGRHAHISGDGAGACGRLCDDQHRYRSRRQHGVVCPRPSEKVVDFGYRAIHEMTVQAKAIVNGFYSSAPKCSASTAARSASAGDHRGAALPGRLRRHRHERGGLGRHGSVQRRHHEQRDDAADVGRLHSGENIPRCTRCCRPATASMASETASSRIRWRATSIPRCCSASRARTRCRASRRRRCRPRR
jgi:hypothetical protein